MPKDVSAKPKRETPPLVLSDPAAVHAASAFGPEALAEAAKLDAAKQTPPTPTPAPPAPEKTVEKETPTGSGNGNSSTTSPTGKPESPAPVLPVPKPVSAARPVPKRAATPVRPESAPIEDLQKITVRVDEAARKFLKRFRRRPYKIAETLVAEYALEQLFAAESLESVSQTLHGLGHGLRRSSKDVGQRWPITVYADTEMLERLESLRDDYNVAMGTVGAHAIDWLRAHQSEEQIAAALRERGFGLYRVPRTAARDIA